MATEATFRPYVDQENAGNLNLVKGTNVQGRTFGVAKSFQSSNVPLTTPRRALGDVGNTIQPSGTTTKKGLRFKSNQLKSCGKTPSATKTHQGTPLTKGLPLLQQIGNTSLKQSGKQRQGLCPKMAEKSREKTQQDFQKELMYPFTDRENVLPRPTYVSTILNNVATLYQGCQHKPMSFSDSNLDDDVPSLIHLETERRPIEDTLFDSLPFEREVGSLTQGFSVFDSPEIDLPPVNINLLGLDLP